MNLALKIDWELLEKQQAILNELFEELKERDEEKASQLGGLINLISDLLYGRDHFLPDDHILLR